MVIMKLNRYLLRCDADMKIGYWYNKGIKLWIVGIKGMKLCPIFANDEKWAIKRAEQERDLRFPNAKIVKLEAVEHAWDNPIWNTKC